MDKKQLDFNTKFKGSTAPTKPKVYTGVNLIGIATMHKSNAVPVFSISAAKDISNMGKK